MTRVALIGCGKSKREGTHSARDLYTGPLFKAALAHAEATADRVFVLSAFHGLLPLDEKIDSYDRTLTTVAEREAWAERIVSALLHDVPGTMSVWVYAGAAYADDVCIVLRRYSTRVGLVERPLQGMTQGARLAWFKAQRSVAAGSPPAGAAIPAGTSTEAA